MALEKMKNIDNLILLDKDKKIIDHTVQHLTAPGENYGSLMLKVDVTVQSAKGGTEVLNLVAKTVPPNEFIQEIFNTQVTFRNEIGFYRDIVPTLQQFQRENGVQEVINFAAKYFGSRVNLKDDQNAKVDMDAALVLENLKVKGFTSLDRMKGYDEDAIKLILTDLAYFHGVSLALKVKKPEVFERKVKPHLKTWTVKKDGFNDMKNTFLKSLERIPELKHLTERASTTFDTLINELPSREPFATLCHNDVWVNNTMFKVEEGKPIESRLVDYQVCSYGSPARDVLFVLFTSVQTQILRESFDDLIKFYYDKFRSVLEELNTDLTQFSFEAFQKELDFEAKYSQFGHIGFMLFPIFLEEKDAKDVSELSEDIMKEQSTEPSPAYIEKLTFVIKEYEKRKWI